MGQASYIERAGATDKAEQRRKALMARHSGYRVAEEGKRHSLTQAQLAEDMGGDAWARIADRARRGRHHRRHRPLLEAIGGRLDLIASFGDHTLTVATTEAA